MPSAEKSRGEQASWDAVILTSGDWIANAGNKKTKLRLRMILIKIGSSEVVSFISNIFSKTLVCVWGLDLHVSFKYNLDISDT